MAKPTHPMPPPTPLHTVPTSSGQKGDEDRRCTCMLSAVMSCPSFHRDVCCSRPSAFLSLPRSSSCHFRQPSFPRPDKTVMADWALKASSPLSLPRPSSLTKFFFPPPSVPHIPASSSRSLSPASILCSQLAHIHTLTRSAKPTLLTTLNQTETQLLFFITL